MISQVRPPVEYPNSSNPHDEPSHLKNDIVYQGKENDVFATEEDLPDGINPVFFFVSMPRGVEGKYTHSAISIAFFLGVRKQSEEDINFMISRGGIGCLYIKDHKIQSLTVHKDMLERLQKGDIKEVVLRMGSTFKSIDHTFAIRLYTSEEEYQTYSAKIIPALKHYGLLEIK